MAVDELVEKVKSLIREGKLEDAKKFVEAHKDEIGDKVSGLTDLLGKNTEGIADKIKDFFGK